MSQSDTFFSCCILLFSSSSSSSSIICFIILSRIHFAPFHFDSFCLGALQWAHFISQNHAYCAKAKRVSVISMRLNWKRNTQKRSKKKNDCETLCFSGLLLHSLIFVGVGTGAGNSMKLFSLCGSGKTYWISRYARYSVGASVCSALDFCASCFYLHKQSQILASFYIVCYNKRGVCLFIRLNSAGQWSNVCKWDRRYHFEIHHKDALRLKRMNETMNEWTRTFSGSGWQFNALLLLIQKHPLQNIGAYAVP